MEKKIKKSNEDKKYPIFEVGDLVQLVDYRYRYDKNGEQIQRKKFDDTVPVLKPIIVRLLDTLGVITDVFLAEEVYSEPGAHLPNNICYKVLSHIDMKEYYMFQDELRLAKEHKKPVRNRKLKKERKTK